MPKESETTILRLTHIQSKKPKQFFFPHSHTVHLDIIKVFTPTDAQVFKRSIKIYIKTAPTRFGVITIIRERTI
jgi:hypothetical protein